MTIPTSFSNSNIEQNLLDALENPESQSQSVPESDRFNLLLSPSDLVEKTQQCTCKDCGKMFNSVWYLKQHAVKHSNDRPFKCKFCCKTYKFRSNLYQHKCPDRVKPLNSKRSRSAAKMSLPSHDSPSGQSSSSGGTSTPNNVSNGISIDDRLLPIIDQQKVDEFVERHRNMLHQCRKCKLMFPSREYLSRHTAAHVYGEARHRCLHCSQTFLSERDYARHKQLHVPQSQHSCRVCAGQFRSALALRRHVDQSRPCGLDSSFGMDLQPSNPYAFIDRAHLMTLDSGLGSSSDSSHSHNASPEVVLGRDHQQQQQHVDAVVTADMLPTDPTALSGVLLSRNGAYLPIIQLKHSSNVKMAPRSNGGELDAEFGADLDERENNPGLKPTSGLSFFSFGKLMTNNDDSPCLVTEQLQVIHQENSECLPKFTVKTTSIDMESPDGRNSMPFPNVLCSPQTNGFNELVESGRIDMNEGTTSSYGHEVGQEEEGNES